jgi:hypothetical protein
VNFCNTKEEDRIALGKKTRLLTEKNYNWDDIAKKWEKHLDHIDDTYRSNWSIPAYSLNKIRPDFTTDADKYFETTAKLCIDHIKDMDMISSMSMLSLLQYADYGFSMHGVNINRHDYKDIITFLITYIDNVNQSDRVRFEGIKFNDDFIEYASIKANT